MGIKSVLKGLCEDTSDTETNTLILRQRFLIYPLLHHVHKM